MPSAGYLPDPGIKHGSPALQVNSLPSEPPGKPYLSIIKALYDKLTSYSMVKAENFSSKPSNKTTMLTLTTSLQHSTESPS